MPHHHPHAHADHWHAGPTGHDSIRLDPLAAARHKVHRVGRRRFLADLGRRTFAVAILGGAIAACSGDDDAPIGSDRAVTDPPDEGLGEVPVDRLTLTQVSLGFVSAYVLARGNVAAIVDTGGSGSADDIGETLRLLGMTYDDVDHVVLTHHHGDHIGSLPDVMDRSPTATAYAGTLDIPEIAGADLVAVGDGDDVFGLQVIDTPGHTPGSISLFDPEAGLLVAGDALNGNDDGTAITGPNARFTADMEVATASVAKLAGLDGVVQAVFGHGQPVSSGAGELIRALT